MNQDEKGDPSNLVAMQECRYAELAVGFWSSGVLEGFVESQRVIGLTGLTGYQDLRYLFLAGVGTRVCPAKESQSQVRALLVFDRLPSLGACCSEVRHSEGLLGRTLGVRTLKPWTPNSWLFLREPSSGPLSYSSEGPTGLLGLRVEGPFRNTPNLQRSGERTCPKYPLFAVK